MPDWLPKSVTGWLSVFAAAGCLGFFLWIIVGGWFDWANELNEKAQSTRKGFEVKPITGQTPVPLIKKENDHG